MKKNEIEKKEALKELKNILKGTAKDKNGYRLTIKIERVARSNMSRCLTIYAQNKKGFYKNITQLVAIITENKYTKDGYLRINGCGMDMLFYTCYTLNSAAIQLDNYKGHTKTNYNYLVNTSYILA